MLESRWHMYTIIETILSWVTELGPWGIMLGLMIEVIPSEIVLAFGGYLVAEGRVSFLTAVIFGTIGGTLAHIFIYWIGRYGGRPFLEKYGKYILIKEKHITLSEQWFERYGPVVVFTARFVPVVRHAISIPAGIARMPLPYYTLLTTLAVIPWTIFFVYIGSKLGDKWREIEEVAKEYVGPFALCALALLLLYFGYMMWVRRRTRKAAGEIEQPEVEQ